MPTLFDDIAFHFFQQVGEFSQGAQLGTTPLLAQRKRFDFAHHLASSTISITCTTFQRGSQLNIVQRDNGVF